MLAHWDSWWERASRFNGAMEGWTPARTVDITARYIPQHLPPRYKPKLSMAML
jgi:hypothetical protein